MSSIEADVTIIGGGLIGCMAAYFLRKRGRSVVVMERALVGGESSGVSFGSLRLQGQRDTELPLALRAQEIWESIETEFNESVEFAQEGHVHLALNPEHVARLEQNAAHMRPSGLNVVLLDRNETLRCWPFLGEQVLAASFSPRDAVVNPRLVTPAFARAALRLGAVIREHTEVVAVETGNGRFATRAKDKAGADQIVVSEVLINAAGAWSGGWASQFGEVIPVFAAGPAEMVTEPVPPFVAPVMHVVDGSVLFRQTSRGNVIIGGHPRISVDAETRRTRVPPDKIATNLARLIAVAPHMRAHHVIRTWTGIEGYISDMKPVVGPSATTPGLFHACAFSGHGLQVGPAVGVALAELIVDGKTEMPIAPLTIGRFQEGQGKLERPLEEEFNSDVRQPQRA